MVTAHLFRARPWRMLLALVLTAGLGFTAAAPVDAAGGSLPAVPPISPAAASTAAKAHTVDLSPTPPDLTKSVAPNIVVTFDDSGSMMATAMPDSVANLGNRDEYYYYSSTTNLIYYNPKTIYSPPLKPDGTSFPDSDYNDAWRDGMCANTPDSYCHKNIHKTNLSDHFYDGFVNGTSTGKTSNDYGQYDIPQSLRTVGKYVYNGGFYLNCPTPNSNAGCKPVAMNFATDAQKQNFANWFSYYRTRNLMARTSLTRAFGELEDTVRVVWQDINHDKLGSSSRIKALSGQWRKDFFDWIYNIHTTGSTPDRHATIRAGDFFSRKINEKNDKNPYWNGKNGKESGNLSCRQNFHMLVTDGYWNEGNPGVSGIHDSQTDLTLPDGHDFSTSDAQSKIFWNVRGTKYESSLANIAFHYWATDLEPDLENNVSPYVPDTTTGITGSTSFDPDAEPPANDPLNNKEIYWNPANDPATWQHVVQYMVTLGVAGTLNYTPDQGGDYTALRKGTKSWPRPKNNQPEAVDDTWHAAINSRGQYFSAKDPNQLVTSLDAILRSIISRRTSSVTGVLNTPVLTNGTISYSTGYDTSDWSGSVDAKPVNADGSLGNAVWKAADKLDAVAPGNRNIATSSAPGQGNGVAFEWSDLSGQEQTWLNADPSSTATPPASDSDGSKRLDWLRGDRSQEDVLLRKRSTVLGAVIHSQATYVAYPADGYRNTWPTKIDGKTVSAPEDDVADDDASDCATKHSCHTYEQFVYNHRDRSPTIYVGANDGMLHAFDAEQNDDGSVPAAAGIERWAYVPYAVYPRLNKLTRRTNYQFTPTVDATPVTRDVFFSDDSVNKWQSILVGGLRLGGRGVYALNITDPTASSNSDVASKVLWEFTNTSAGADPGDPTKANNPANLGYTYGRPNIGRLANGKWVVLVPGGYFPKTGPGSNAKAASRGFSSLFVLNAQTGALIKELRTPTSIGGKSFTSYGLSSPVLGDYDDDQVDDVAFAGDLEGNLWRFDLSDPSPANWTVDLAYKPKTPGNQPITVMPRLFPDPAGSGFMVVFGTGKFLGLSDRTTTDEPTQTVYGIREPGTSGGDYVTHADLVKQTLYESTDGQYTRAGTSNSVPADKGGWYIDLDVADGERVTVTPAALFNTNRAIISTLIPGSNDPCDPSRKGSLLVVDADTGGASAGLDFPVWGGSKKQPTGTKVVGGRVNNPPTGGTLPVATPVGGGKVMLPGISFSGSGKTVSAGDRLWRRRSWHVLDVN